MPEEGWGDDTPMNRSKRPKKKVKNRGLDQFSHWIAKVTPYDEPYDDIGSFTPEKDTRNSEYRPYSIPAYPEPLVRPTEAEIPEVTLCLPTLSVSLTATVDGTVAHTELVQKFRNPSDEIIDAAKHVFPLYDGAVITSFECTIGDERRVRGVVKPKVQARKEFEEAVRDKVAAPALLEEHTPEIFETSLGNIPANTTVEIKITYVQELKVVMMETEATEGIALTIPMSIAPRYSKSPIEWEPASRVPEEKLDIWIKVIDNGKVNHEGCDEESGHLLKFEGAKPVEYSNLLEKDASTRTYYVWHHESEPPVLRKDFVFVIQMNEGHQIKSRAIACPADDKGLAAMRVNIRPNNLFRNAIIPQSFTGEILFLLDQSGSMGWSNGSPGYGRRRTGGRKIDVMREAMLLALSGIPSTCIFNIISWGSATVGLWENSQPHTQENIREAKSYVSRMEANMDGTDLLRALEAVVKRRVQERESTQIIILTDGELEPEDSIQFIWKKRQLFGDKVRFFALGIGDEVSHRLVESIAECGGGYSDVVHTTQTPRWHDRLNRLLKSALEPNSWSCDIDLGSGFERKNVVDYNLGQDNPADGSDIPYIQAPFPISSLHPFTFASISFLIDLRHGGAIPKTITISTTTAGAKKKTYELPIETSSGSDGTIHRLVAKSVLLDLQDSIKRGTTETEVAKGNAESIGTMYSITSKWTSFVAVSENQPNQTVEEQKMNHYKALFDEIDIDELLNNVDDESSITSGSSLEFSGVDNQGPGMNSLPWSPQFARPPSHNGYGRQLESANPIPIPAPMPRYAPVQPSPGQSSQPRYTGDNRLGQHIVEEGSLRNLYDEDDSDESEALPRAGPPVTRCMSPPGPVAPQGSDDSGDAITSRRHRVSDHSSEVLQRRPWERPGSTMSQIRPNSVDDDVTIPSRQRVYGYSSSSVSAFQDIPPFPNDSSYQEAERLERTRAETTDGSVSDLLLLTEEDAVAGELIAVTSKPSGDESHGQAAATLRGSKSSYALPLGNRRPRLPKDYAYDGNSDDDTAQGSRPQKSPQSASPSRRPSADENGRVLEPANSTPSPEFYAPPVFSGHIPRPKSIVVSERLSEKVHRRKEFAQAEVADEPMVAPSANHGFAIPAAMIKPEEPQASDDSDTSQKASYPSSLAHRPGSSDGLARERSMVTNVDSEVFILGGRQRFDRLSKPDMPRPVASPSGRPSVDERGKAPSSQASSQSGEFASLGRTPRRERENAPGSPQFLNPSAFQRQPRTVQSWDSDYDSDYDIKSLGSRDSASPQPEIHGPLDWQFAMECQDGQGLFDLGEKKPFLHLHFCPETATKISPKICELLHNSSIPEQERDDISARLLDTLMMIECYKTHRAQEEDTWDLMMERAWDAVISVLGLSDEEEELEELAGQLRGAMMHAHYIAATGVTGSETDGHTVNTVRCPTCNVVWRTTRQFWCPFDHDYDNEVDEILNWDDFWKHQSGTEVTEVERPIRSVDISVSYTIEDIMDPDKTSTDGGENVRGSTGSQPLLSTPDMDRRIRHAFDRRVMPVVCCLYVLSYLDRGNIGNAKTAGAQEALNLSSDDWSWVLNSFYIAYILFEWTTMLWKIFPAHIYVSILCVCWGTAAMCSGAVHNMTQLIVTRIFLGIFEATFGAGAPFFLSCLYKRRELGLRMSILLGMSPLANTFASSLAYGITHIKGSLAPWRLLFIIEGAPTIAFAPVVYFFLIDSPATAKFLTEEERYFAVQRVQGPDGVKKNVNWRQIMAGILDYKNYVHSIIHFCCNFSFAALSNFLPTIVSAMGYSSINAQGLTAPAYFTAFLLCMGAAFFSDRCGNRGFVVAGFAAMATVGYGLLAGIQDIHRPGPRYAGVWLAACGIFPALCINITWLLNNQGRDSKKGAGLAITLIIGQCSSLLSSYMFPKEDAPFFVKGCAIGCGMSGAIVILALFMHFALERENMRNEKLYGPLDNDAEVDDADDGEQGKNFRYLT
ncbi:hypothetical protein NOF04DRAFT_15671 [Fusarium oxysporum II5]|nr:uncharacterized protein FOIG_03892 [Fusarium odoratissimum NRRL 54006]EXM07361.1 hypothetical protein FOIG_03892 [Fusarium odoratissimum NRRL 54006]KAK2132360.1 hypothetical protein NOF04DRAFT_15671 [Fusarium oxysporum II5]